MLGLRDHGIGWMRFSNSQAGLFQCTSLVGVPLADNGVGGKPQRSLWFGVVLKKHENIVACRKYGT